MLRSSLEGMVDKHEADIKKEILQTKQSVNRQRVLYNCKASQLLHLYTVFKSSPWQTQCWSTLTKTPETMNITNSKDIILNVTCQAHGETNKHCSSQPLAYNESPIIETDSMALDIHLNINSRFTCKAAAITHKHPIWLADVNTPSRHFQHHRQTHKIFSNDHPWRGGGKR